MDIVCMSGAACSIPNCKHHRADLCSHSHTENPNHPCKTAQLDTYKVMVSDTEIVRWRQLSLVKMSRDLQWSLGSVPCVWYSAIATSSLILTKHNHLGISVHLAHICNISRTYQFDKILPSIYSHVIRQKNQSLFLLTIEKKQQIIRLTSPGLKI